MVAESKWKKLRAAFWTVNIITNEEERKARIEAINNNRKTRKSLMAEEVTAVNPETGEEGKWVRPKIMFDASPEHVPPPPPGLVPTFGLPAGGGRVPIKVMDAKSEGGTRVVMAKAVSGKFPAAMRESAKSSSDGFKEMSASLGAKRRSSVNAVGAVPVSESVSASMKARAKSVALKSSSFGVEARSEAEVKEVVETFKRSSFRKSITADALVTEDPLTGKKGTWVRPHLHFDPSSEHIPPPPSEPVPAELSTAPSGGGAVPMEVLDESSRQGRRTLMARANSGVFKKPEKTKTVEVEVVNVS